MSVHDVQPRLCPICSGVMTALDVIDLNRACHGMVVVPSVAGVPIYYFRCGHCGFCNAPEMCKWSVDEFEQRVYNSDYALVDPDYLGARPCANAERLKHVLGSGVHGIRHLDYGGGNGLLSNMLRDQGWDSRSYDPFSDRGVELGTLGTFDLITAFEVFEHVPDVNGLMADIAQLLEADGIVIFSTLVSDGSIVPNERLTWWYAAPRNGHISLFSRESLGLLGANYGFRFGSFSPDSHAYWRAKPKWARELLGASD